MLVKVFYLSHHLLGETGRNVKTVYCRWKICRMERDMFRDDFVWGVASSAYQIEGTDQDDGRGKCVWDVFTEEGHIHENQNAYTACDHMHRYQGRLCSYEAV